MGSIITKVYVKGDVERGEDFHYHKLTIEFDGTKADLLETVNNFLRDQVRQGFIKTNRLRNIIVEDETDDQSGIFGHFVAEFKELIFD